MKCSICGAKLKKAGDVCNNCYKEFQEEEALKKDVKEVYKIRRKYAIKYEMIKYLWILIIFGLCLAISIIAGRIGEFFITLLILAVILGVLLFIDKRIATGTKVVFYEKKVVYTFKFLFINKRKVIKYSDLKDVSYFQVFKQKLVGMGDLCFYAKGAIPGVSLLNGFQIKDVENVAEVLRKIKEIVGTIE